MRRKPKLESRLEKCAFLLIKEPQKLRGCWLDEFKFKELRVELGCGKGRFTVETAKETPGTLFIALEKVANVIVIALERAEQEKLQNVRFINGLADDLPAFFAEGEVSSIYINFCDPWPTNRHKKRRLTCWSFLELYKKVLKPDGEILFKTDDLPLFEFSIKSFEQCGFSLLEISRDLHKNGPVDVMTDYELKFYDQGKAIYSARAAITDRRR